MPLIGLGLLLARSLSRDALRIPDKIRACARQLWSYSDAENVPSRANRPESGETYPGAIFVTISQGDRPLLNKTGMKPRHAAVLALSR
jgi:hypothetical protein